MSNSGSDVSVGGTIGKKRGRPKGYKPGGSLKQFDQTASKRRDKTCNLDVVDLEMPE